MGMAIHTIGYGAIFFLIAFATGEGTLLSAFNAYGSALSFNPICLS